MGQSSNGTPRRSAPMHLLLSQTYVHTDEVPRAIVAVPFIVVQVISVISIVRIEENVIVIFLPEMH